MRVQVAACVPALVPNVQYLEVHSRPRFEFANVTQGAINVSGRQALFCRTLVKSGLTDLPHIICDLNCLFRRRDAPAFLGMNQALEITQTFCASGQRCICATTAGSNSLECSQVCDDVLCNCMPSALCLG